MAYDQTQEMFLLALSSHAGADCNNVDVIDCVDEKIKTTLSPDKWALTDWQIVWGPGVAFDPTSDHPSTAYPANVMYAAYRETDAQLCISISATNQHATYDLAEDFMVHKLERWPYAPEVQDLLAPKISEGYSKAFDLLRGVKPGKTSEGDLPGFDKTLVEWLADFVSAHPDVSIITTGQSLGGALAPIIALWLWETQKDWNPDGIVKPNQFSCLRFSAPTPGNRAFAHYYNERLPATNNVINTRDFAPKMFDEETLREIHTLYLPIKPGLRMTNLLNEFRLAVAGKGYTQPGELARRSFESPIPDLQADNECLMFTNQMGYHHLLAYFHGLGLEALITGELSEAYHQFNSLCARRVVDALKS